MQIPILWPELVAEWELSPDEAAYIDRQQGFGCSRCGSNLRSMALASALLSTLGLHGTLQEPEGDIAALRIVEINEAGHLTQFLTTWPRHRLVQFPEVDMRALPFSDESVDIVVHSDTLEHVPDPVAGLTEVRRILAADGFTCFTVPVVVGRLTRDREDMAPSHHGSPGGHEHLVHTEYGADVWTQVIRAGFDECRVHSLEYPAGIALVASKGIPLPLKDAVARRLRADLAEQRDTLTSRDNQIEDLQRELRAITGSRGWQSVLMVRRAARVLRRR